jgi:hypothetical protein
MALFGGRWGVGGERERRRRRMMERGVKRGNESKEKRWQHQ